MHAVHAGLVQKEHVEEEEALRHMKHTYERERSFENLLNNRSHKIIVVRPKAIPYYEYGLLNK